MIKDDLNENIVSSKLYHLISIANLLQQIDLDELAVQCLIGREDRKRCYHFYGQLINSFSSVKAIEIKMMALKVVCNKNIFEDFVRE